MWALLKAYLCTSWAKGLPILRSLVHPQRLLQQGVEGKCCC